MQKIISFIKNNAFSIACFLVAAIVFVGGSISYARYTTQESASTNVGAGSFTCSSSIDGISALSFTNTDFWGTAGEGEQIALNVLRSLDMTVNNFEINDGEKKISQTRSKYELSLVAPIEFASVLAFQLFDEGVVAILPQIIVADLIACGKNGVNYNTSNSLDYNGSFATDLVFAVQETGDGEYVATTAGITIKLQKVSCTLQQSVEFRLWDVSALTDATTPTMTNEVGTLLSPLVIKYTSSVDCYRISISMDSFVFDANVEQTHKYSMRLAPTSEVVDNMLGQNLGVRVDMDVNNVTSIKDDDVIKVGETYWLNSDITAESIKFNGEVLGENDSVSFFEQVDGVWVQKYFISVCFCKSYPTSINVLFEQAQ